MVAKSTRSGMDVLLEEMAERRLNGAANARPGATQRQHVAS